MSTRDTEDLTTLLGIGLLGIIGYALVSNTLNNIYQYPAEVKPAKDKAKKPAAGAKEEKPAKAPKEEKPAKQPKAEEAPVEEEAAAPVARGGAGGANTPEKLGYKGTGQKVEMTSGAAHRNGQRYNVNHKYKNYLIIGHYKIGSGQQTINCKTDGPNHGSCTALPKCVWIEPNLTISSGKLDMTSEWPHPKGHNGMPCPSCKTIGAVSGWLGWAQALYQDGEFRHIDVWTDKGGTGGQWTKIASETDKGQITNATLAKRPLFLEGKGLEAEVRMHGAKGGDTAKRDAWVFEITPPASSGFAQSFFSFLQAKIPRRYNNIR